MAHFDEVAAAEKFKSRLLGQNVSVRQARHAYRSRKTSFRSLSKLDNFVECGKQTELMELSEIASPGKL